MTLDQSNSLKNKARLTEPGSVKHHVTSQVYSPI